VEPGRWLHDISPSRLTKVVHYIATLLLDGAMRPQLPKLRARVTLLIYCWLHGMYCAPYAMLRARPPPTPRVGSTGM
jgi:hypothetical protein